MAASANGESGWLSAKFACRSTVRVMRPCLPISTMPAVTSVRKMPMARNASSRWRAGFSWLS